MTFLATQVPVAMRIARQMLAEGIEDGTEGEARLSTRTVAASVKQESKEAEEEGPFTKRFVEEPHYFTDGAQTGAAGIHVAHAWDASFEDLCSCIGDDAAAESDWERMYVFDLLTTDLHSACENIASDMQASVSGASKVLLVLDEDALALRRLCVIFEAMLGHGAGKLVVRCSAEGGFGSSVEAIRRWERHIDGADWAMAETSRKHDDKKLREFAETNWEANGKGIERTLARFKIDLRKEVYGQILVAAVEAGNLDAVALALDLGADPEFRDRQGNVPEDLASCNGREDIAELVFERRMGKLPCQSLQKMLREWEQSLGSAVDTPYLTETKHVAEMTTSWGNYGPNSARSDMDSFDWAQLAVT